MEENTARLVNCLCYGEKNAKTQEKIAEEMGVSPIDVRRTVNEARTVDRVVICNYRNGKGNFLPETNDELMEQYRKTYRRGKAVFAQLSALMKAMEMNGQMTIEDLIAETEAIV